ncbi:MAG: hypothetical protein IPH09_07420 [bacterium]|nr:hypothetical protein [bacterium]
MPSRSLAILDRIAGLRLAVVGDAMLDRFLWGEVERISPEAPVPVVRLRRETDKLGGAANVAANIRALGADVSLVAVAGAGATSRRLVSLLGEAGIPDDGLLRLPGRRTTLKTRIIAHSQQIVRADVESDEPLAPQTPSRTWPRGCAGWARSTGSCCRTTARACSPTRCCGRCWTTAPPPGCRWWSTPSAATTPSTAAAPR